MPTATITSKGQVTIPKEVRDRLGVHQGDRVEFVVDAQGLVHLKPLKRSVRELAGCLYRPAAAPLTQAELDASLLEAIAEDDERVRAGR